MRSTSTHSRLLQNAFGVRLLAVGLLLCGVPFSASAFQARMDLSPEVIRIGEAATLTLVVQGVDRPPTPQIPAIKGLQISGPHVGSRMSTTVVNGEMQTERAVTFQFRIIPTAPGEYPIGPFSYQADGSTVDLPARTLRVAGAGGQAADGAASEWSDLVFAQLTVEKEQIYVQENLTITLSIYSRGVNLGGDVSLLNMPDSSIQMQPFQELQPQREIVKGEVYDVRRYRTTLRALTSGALTFEPGLRVQLLVQRDQRRRGLFEDSFFQGFFSNTEAHPLDLKVEPVHVDVLALPEQGRPAGFTGGVGQFNMDLRVEPRAVKVGDPITLTLAISGQGNIDALSAPQVTESDAFRVYAPRMTSRELNATQSSGRKQFEQIVIPRTAEATEIPALEFSFFNPETGQYQTITKGPVPLQLDASEAAATRWVRGDSNSVDSSARILGEDIRYLKPAPAHWTRAQGAPWHRHPLFLTAQGVPLLLLLGTLVWARRRRALEQNVALARRTRAPRRTRAGLRQAEAALRAKDAARFHDGIWLALTRYFGDRLNLPPGEVTGERVCSLMATRGLNEAAVATLRDAFQACDQARFARNDAPDQADNPERLAQQLEQIRQLFKQCERVRK